MSEHTPAELPNATQLAALNRRMDKYWTENNRLTTERGRLLETVAELVEAAERMLWDSSTEVQLRTAIRRAKETQ